MGYTLSFDASAKCKRGDVKGLIRYVARNVDRLNDCELNHSNDNIDPERTELNRTYFYNQLTSEFESCTSRKQIEESLETRLKTVKNPLRKDAVVVRSLILQLDPEWYKDHADDEHGDTFNPMVAWATKTFGAKNIVGVSLHFDESNSHAHLLFTPVTDDGRLNQKDWFSSPEALRKMHEGFRQHMRDEGYDINLQNVKPGKYAKRIPEKEYRDFAQLEAERQSVVNDQQIISRRKAQLDEREADLNRRERALDDREKALGIKISKEVEVVGDGKD